MTDDPDGDRIVIDLTSTHEMDRMARGRMSHRYNEAVKERLRSGPAGRLQPQQRQSLPRTLSGADRDRIGQKDDEPADAVFDYIGDEQLLHTVEDHIGKR